AITWAGITDAYPALGRLEGVMISGDEGHCKPDEVIFRRCESRFGFTADQVLFLADSTAAVERARAVGWDAEVFTTARAARAALVRRGRLSVCGPWPPPRSVAAMASPDSSRADLFPRADQPLPHGGAKTASVRAM